MTVTFGSVCSGIEAASVAWNSLGWHAAWLSEIEPFPATLLSHHYPYVPNMGDMRALPDLIRSGALPAPDVLAGGTPCQAFSVAGLRKSLDDARGNLSLTFCEIANAIDEQRPGDECVIVWENVPGVLSTKDNAFGCFLAALAGEDVPLQPPGGKWTNAGYVSGPQRTVAWRVLDAQYFGLAQRRRRVFVVASARNGFDPAAVLFEFDGVRRDSPPRREARQGTTVGTLRSTDGGSDVDPLVPICVSTGQASAEIGIGIGTTLNCNHEAPYIAHTLRGEGFDASEDGTGRGTPLVPVAFHHNAQACQLPGPGRDTRISDALTCSQHAAVAFALRGRDEGALPEIHGEGNSVGALRAANGGSSRDYIAASAVRRLAPRECERLQGFPTCTERLRIDVCIDRQSGFADAGLSCLKWQNNVSLADGSGSTPPVSTADHSSNTRQADRAPLVAAHVLLGYEDRLQEVRSLGKLTWSANGAAPSSASPPCTQRDGIARALAQPAQELVSLIQAGKAGSPASIRLSIPAKAGSRSALQSGSGMAANAAVVESDRNRDTFTTSELGRLNPACDSRSAILCCSALRAIAGLIQSQTLTENFSLEISVEAPYSLIPVRGKPAADGPRYKALGNSWAVPVVAWIGARIDSALRLT